MLYASLATHTRFWILRSTFVTFGRNSRWMAVVAISVACAADHANIIPAFHRTQTQQSTNRQARSCKLHGLPSVSAANFTMPAVLRRNNERASNDHQTLRSRAPRHQAGNVNQRYATMMLKYDCLCCHMSWIALS